MCSRASRLAARCSNRRFAPPARSTACRRRAARALRERLERWLDAQIARHLRPLKILASAATDPASSPGVRALAAMLADAGGLLPRKSDAQRDLASRAGRPPGAAPAAHPSRSARRLRSTVAQARRATLARCACSPCAPASRCRRCRRAGAATLTAEADPRGAALAYRRLGREWIRIDLADRLASHARKVRSAGGDDPVDADLATSVGLVRGCDRRLMAEVGFTRAGDAWRWRGRRPPRDDRRAASTHAFAELEKLRRK